MSFVETFPDSCTICKKIQPLFSIFWPHFEHYLRDETWSFCSCFLRFAASFFFRFFRCFAVSSFDASPSAMLDLPSQLIQSNQRISKYRNQWKGDNLANQMSRNGKMRALPEIQRLFTNKHFNGFRNGRWVARLLFFQWSGWFLLRFPRRMWRLWTYNSRVVAVTMSIWFLWEIFLPKLWISLSKMWRPWSPLSFHLLVSRQACLPTLRWM